MLGSHIICQPGRCVVAHVTIFSVMLLQKSNTELTSSGLSPDEALSYNIQNIVNISREFHYISWFITQCKNTSSVLDSCKSFLSCILCKNPVIFPVRFGQPLSTTTASFFLFRPSLSQHTVRSLNKWLAVIVHFCIAASSSVISKVQRWVSGLLVYVTTQGEKSQGREKCKLSSLFFNRTSRFLCNGQVGLKCWLSCRYGGAAPGDRTMVRFLSPKSHLIWIT